jgi:hypothetical protein
MLQRLRSLGLDLMEVRTAGQELVDRDEAPEPVRPEPLHPEPLRPEPLHPLPPP